MIEQILWIGLILFIVLIIVAIFSENSGNYAFDDDNSYSNYISYDSDLEESTSSYNEVKELPSSFNKRNSDGNVVDYYLQDVSGNYVGSDGKVLMKDAVGEGYHMLDGSVYYVKDRYGNYAGSDGSYYRYDRYGDLVNDDGESLTRN